MAKPAVSFPSLPMSLLTSLLMSLPCLAMSAAENPSVADQPAQKTCELTSSDYAVFGAVLERLHNPSHGKVLILDITSGTPKDVPPVWAIHPKTNEGPSSKTFDGFIENPDTACPINLVFGDTKSYSLIAHQEVNDLFLDPSKPASSDSWDTFHKKFDSPGFFRFSRPRYNSAHSEVLVNVALSCGPLCGGGTLFLLSRQEGKWIVKNRTSLWLGMMLGE